jgi:hypothetical protein
VEPLDINSENPHFSDEQWADFVRGIGDQALSAKMQAHLASDCTVCHRTVQWLTDFSGAALAESQLEVPDALVQQAREIFVASPALPRQTPRLIETWEILSSELIRQEGLGWQPAGVRASAAAAANTGERMLFRAGEYVVDLQVEPPGSASGGEIIGQIAKERESTEGSESTEGWDEIVVELLSEGRAVAETTSNRFGEFVIEYSSIPNAVLRLALTHRKQRIELPISLD